MFVRLLLLLLTFFTKFLLNDDSLVHLILDSIGIWCHIGNVTRKKKTNLLRFLDLQPNKQTKKVQQTWFISYLFSFSYSTHRQTEQVDHKVKFTLPMIVGE